MKAIKIFIDKEEQYKMLNLVEELNTHEDIAMAVVNPDEFVIATTGECSMSYVKAVIKSRFNDYSMETIK